MKYYIIIIEEMRLNNLCGLADGWKDYEVIDCSKGEKLERWGEYLLVRPDPQVIWDTPKNIKAGKDERTLSPQQQRRR